MILEIPYEFFFSWYRKKSPADGPLRRPLTAHQCIETGHLYQHVVDLLYSGCLPGGYSPCCAAACRQSSEKLCDPAFSTPSQDCADCGRSIERPASGRLESLVVQ